MNLESALIKFGCVFKNLIYLFFIYFILIKLPVFLLSYEHLYVFSGDDGGYAWLAKSDFLSAILIRPFLYPLYIRCCFNNVDVVFWSQFFISAWSWAFFTQTALQRAQHNFIKFILVFIISLLVSSIYITNWDVKILTESLSISFLVLSIGCLFQKPLSTKCVILFIVSECCFIGLRDSAYLLALPLLLIFIFNKDIKTTYRFITTIIISLFTCFIILTSYYGQRESVNFEDVLIYRVLSNNNYFNWYLQNTNLPDIKNEFDKCCLKEPFFCIPRTSIMYNDKNHGYIEQNQELIKQFPYLLRLLPYFVNKNQVVKDYLLFLINHSEYLYFNNWQDFSFYSSCGPLNSFGFSQSSSQFLDGISIENYGGKSLIVNFNKFRTFSKLQYKIATTFIFCITLLLLLFIRNNAIRLTVLASMLITFFFALLNYLVEPMELPRHCLTSNLFFILITIMYLPMAFNINNFKSTSFKEKIA